MQTKTVLKVKSFVFFDNSRFMNTEYCKAPITSLALLIRVSSSLSCLPSLVNATPRYLNNKCLLQCCSIHLQHALIRVFERRSAGASVLAVLIFIPAVSHASTKLFNARRRADAVEKSRSNSSANSRRLILQLPIVTHSSAWLHLSIQFM